MRIVSWNLNGRLRSERSRHKIIAVLRSLHPDILCLQEVNTRSEARSLAAELGMHWNRRAFHRGGMTILTTGPSSAVRKLSIPNSYCNALVTVRWNGIWIASSHLSSAAYRRSEQQRLHEMRWLARNFRPRRGIWAGDWNSASHLDRGFRSQPELPSHVLAREQWMDTHAKHPHSTWMPATHRLERIDRIYVRGPGWRVLRSATLGPRSFPFLKGRWPTGRDHKLVVMDAV
jgi:endonuclease/exonuclease/phosphatase family metal-dependent hydrolase